MRNSVYVKLPGMKIIAMSTVKNVFCGDLATETFIRVWEPPFRQLCVGRTSLILPSVEEMRSA